MVVNRPSPKRRLWLAGVFTGFISLFSFLTISSFLKASPTYDESIHLFAGYSYIRWGDFRINPEHPPLAKVLAALPLFALDIKDSRQSATSWDSALGKSDFGWWEAAYRWVFLENDAEALFFHAKIPMIALGLLSGIFVHIWTKEIYGAKAAVASLFLYCLDPNILAHSQIVHTDIPFTTFFFIGTYFFWRALNQVTLSNLLLTSFFFGLTAITKYSFLAVLPIWSILGLLKIFSSDVPTSLIGGPSMVWGRRQKAALVAVVIGCALITAYIFIWGVYGFHFEPVSERAERHLPLAMVIPQNSWAQTVMTWATQNEVLPEAWIYGLLYVGKFSTRPTYLLGKISEAGFWHYFPIAFAVKTPLPTVLLLLGALSLIVLKRRVRRAEWFLIVPILIYFSLAVWSRMNIGLRHLLPLYPFLFVFIGGAAGELWGGNNRWRRGGLVLLAIWQIWSSLHIYPHYLAFFNELAGGPKNGYKVLTDSSLDWGQDLKGLKRWMDEQGVKKIQLAYFGTADPKYYGIDALYLPGSIIFSPRPEGSDAAAPQYMAVSATYIYGVHSGEPLREFYKPLRLIEPVTTIGHSIFVYRVD